MLQWAASLHAAQVRTHSPSPYRSLLLTPPSLCSLHAAQPSKTVNKPVADLILAQVSKQASKQASSQQAANKQPSSSSLTTPPLTPSLRLSYSAQGWVDLPKEQDDDEVWVRHWFVLKNTVSAASKQQASSAHPIPPLPRPPHHHLPRPLILSYTQVLALYSEEHKKQNLLTSPVVQLPTSEMASAQRAQVGGASAATQQQHH